MTRTAFKPRNWLIQIGILGALLPTATYASTTVTAGGLKTISTISNEPASLVFVPTAKTADLHKTKANERIKFLTGTETGEIFELDEGIMGSINLVLCRDGNNEAYYDPAIDKLLAAASESNKQLYVRMERYIGFDATALPAPGKHNYHTKAAIINVKLDNSTVSADAKIVEQPFTLEGSGEWIEGYLYK